jgi:hypothetical protein
MGDAEFDKATAAAVRTDRERRGVIRGDWPREDTGSASPRDLRRAGIAVLALPESRIARRHLERALGRAA